MPSLFPQPGPDLPFFKTLLVKGNYHPSAPIHLSFSYISGLTDSQTIIITPSRQSLCLALQEYDDTWIKSNSSRGSVSDLSSKIKLFYPPSPAHLSFLLSMFRVLGPRGENDPWLNPITCLAIAPSLLVLHEPSVYFLPESGRDQPSCVVLCPELKTLTWDTMVQLKFQRDNFFLSISNYTSSVISLEDKSNIPVRCFPSSVMKVASHRQFWRYVSNIAFALFDSRLDQLKLPIVKQPIYSSEGDDGDQSRPRLEFVSLYVERYFEWIAIIDADHGSLDSAQQKSMVLRRTDQPLGPVKSWKWREKHVTAQGGDEGFQGMQFLWES